MDKKLIINGLIVTKDKNNSMYRNGVIYIEDNIIRAIGSKDEIDVDKYSTGAEIIDASGKIIDTFTN